MGFSKHHKLEEDNNAFCLRLPAGPAIFRVLIRQDTPITHTFEVDATLERITQVTKMPEYKPKISKIKYHKPQVHVNDNKSFIYCAAFAKKPNKGFNRCDLKKYLRARRENISENLQLVKQTNMNVSSTDLRKTHNQGFSEASPGAQLNAEMQTDFEASTIGLDATNYTLTCSHYTEQKLNISNDETFQLGLFAMPTTTDPTQIQNQLRIYEYPFTELTSVVPRLTRQEITLSQASSWNIHVNEPHVTHQVVISNITSQTSGKYFLVMTQPASSPNLPVQVEIEICGKLYAKFTLQKYKLFYLKNLPNLLSKENETETLNRSTFSIKLNHQVSKAETNVSFSLAAKLSSLSYPILGNPFNNLWKIKVVKSEETFKVFINALQCPRCQLEYRVKIFSFYQSATTMLHDEDSDSAILAHSHPISNKNRTAFKRMADFVLHYNSSRKSVTQNSTSTHNPKLQIDVPPVSYDRKIQFTLSGTESIISPGNCYTIIVGIRRLGSPDPYIFMEEKAIHIPSDKLGET